MSRQQLKSRKGPYNLFVSIWGHFVCGNSYSCDDVRMYTCECYSGTRGQGWRLMCIFMFVMIRRHCGCLYGLFQDQESNAAKMVLSCIGSYNMVIMQSCTWYIIK